MKIAQGVCSPSPAEQSMETPTIVRTFVFQREETQQSLIMDLRISATSEAVNLSSLFEQYCPLKQNIVSIYEPESNKFVPLGKIGAEVDGLLPRSLLEAAVVMIRFKRREEEGGIAETDSGVESGMQSSKERKDRSKERTIGEAIELVKKWRMVHMDRNKLGLKRASLAQAARSIGVSKKTLDDYYYQLRLGEFYNFHFAANLNQKVGILRAYVKEFKPEREQKNKNLRHPKNLKIIEEFGVEVPEIVQEVVPSSPILSELQSPSSFKSLSLAEESQGSLPNPFMVDVMTSYEDKFFKNFQFLLDDPNDPFIQIDRNFKKKQFQQQPNSDFFFF